MSPETWDKIWKMITGGFIALIGFGAHEFLCG